jgi:hypothetical protein
MAEIRLRGEAVRPARGPLRPTSSWQRPVVSASSSSPLVLLFPIEDQGMKKSIEEPMGAHWKETKYSPLYQLYRRVETVAHQLRERQKKGWAPLKEHIVELDDVATELKVLDKKAPQQVQHGTQ